MNRIINRLSLEDAIFYLSTSFAQEDTAIVDLDADNGDLIAPLVEACDDSQSFVLLNASEKGRERYKNDPRVIHNASALKRWKPSHKTSVTLAFDAFGRLSLPDRYELAQRIHDHTEPGGALILVEHVRGASEKINDALFHAAHAIRPAPKLITETRISAKRIETFLSCGGFREIDCFYRDIDLAGYIAVRGA